MVKYVEYTFYKEVFGGTMPEASFNRAAIEASVYLKKITFSRIAESDPPEEVKYACCAMADQIYEDQAAKQDGKTVKSVSNDGYSVSYVTEADGSVELTEAKLSRIAQIYLPGDLLYFGLDGSDC
ncbi:hypothetical protein OBO34_21270 [Clostridiales Family XIII bacterium ASD5510]|uniref:Phage protein n=1 Tax=Hominibacterium faecale TaxID=2839743 RepID=A0A9J6QZE1_9FIRM|nr:hypothetical protein [Hominibacterium faecale]MCU7380848.1 hypothetical protein [Hominibacterium faecale]